MVAMGPTVDDILISRSVLLFTSSALLLFNVILVFSYIGGYIKEKNTHLLLGLSIMIAISISLGCVVFSMDVRRMKCI